MLEVIKTGPRFEQSRRLQSRFHEVIPGGSHTYAKGDDQFPEFMQPYLVRGKGCRVTDVDGNEFIEYAPGLRAVTLGHAFERVTRAAVRQMTHGTNFNRPSPIELECAEKLLSLIDRAEMVKFGKNGSDTTSAAVRLARAATGRDYIAVCKDQPFFSVDDWFIGSTPMDAGIPAAIKALTLSFRYNDLESVQALFDEHPGKIAGLILEAEKDKPPATGFFEGVRRLCTAHGALFILDEMITGFRWSNGGAQAYHDLDPDLSVFGKAMGNGFSVSALVGKREFMERGGLKGSNPRVFLLSLTHGAETHSLAAALETMSVYEEEPVIEHLWYHGDALMRGINKSIADHRLQGHVELLGRPCCLVYATRDQEKRPSQPFRTLLLQETMRRGILAPSLVLGYSHQEEDIERTIEAFDESFGVYQKALEDGVERYLIGRPVKPVFRKYN